VWPMGRARGEVGWGWERSGRRDRQQPRGQMTGRLIEMGCAAGRAGACAWPAPRTRVGDWEVGPPSDAAGGESHHGYRRCSQAAAWTELDVDGRMGRRSELKESHHHLAKREKKKQCTSRPVHRSWLRIRGEVMMRCRASHPPARARAPVHDDVHVLTIPTFFLERQLDGAKPIVDEASCFGGGIRSNPAVWAGEERCVG
jgi:hypothetical protein